jgi:hypothetical protein
MTEFDILRQQIARHKERFIQRLIRNTRVEGECVIWTGAHNGGRHGKGYPIINFKIEGQHVQVRVHRLFLVLRLQRQIRRNHEAGHFMCHNKSCVRHVEEQTVAHNRGEVNGRRAKKDCPF